MPVCGLKASSRTKPLYTSLRGNRRRLQGLAHQNRTIAIASDLRVDGAKSSKIPQKEEVSGSEIANRQRLSIAPLNRNAALLSLVSEIASDLGSAMGIAIADRKNRCDFGALSCKGSYSFLTSPYPVHAS